MLLIHEHAAASEQANDVLELPFELRQKARFKATLTSGVEVGLQLARGKILRCGDKLKAEDGKIIEIKAAPESVSTVTCDDALMLAKICYHLGNRHVPLQVMQGQCRYMHDHVLDEMVVLLGGKVICEQASFEPEAGAYANQSHAHNEDSHASSHDHSHVHSHSH